MPKFFINSNSFKDNKAIIDGDSFRHLSKTLRAEVGDEITVGDDSGMDYTCIIDEIFPDHLTAMIQDAARNESEPETEVHLFQCLMKADKMDFVIQKCVELGIHSIYPVSSSRCVVKLDKERGQKKVGRWQKISESSAKQCGRGHVPLVYPVMTLKEAAETAAGLDFALIPYERERDCGLRDAEPRGKKRIGIIIGPEGGFDAEEVEYCIGKGIKPITLGKRILRTETAGMYTLAILLFLTEND